MIRFVSSRSWIIAVVLGCSPADVAPPIPSSSVPVTCPQVVQGKGFYGRPFPDDARLVDGRASYEGFPRREVALVDNVLDVAERHAGWSPYSTLYVPFDAPLDVDALPDLASSIADDSSVRLAPEGGGPAVPLHVRVFSEPTSLLPANTLAVRPAWGRGMRPGGRYILTIASEVGCSGDASVRIPITTAPVVDPLRDMVTVARARLPSGNALGTDWIEIGSQATGVRTYVGILSIPRWQSGEVPYATEGGDIALDNEGMPLIDGFDEVPVAFVHPDGLPPPDGFPVVVHLNGTGGSFDLAFVFGERLAQRGIATVGIDLPLHGVRGAGPAFEQVVNIDNPLASLMTLLQGAADQVWLVDLLAREGARIETPGGPVLLDRDQIGFQGHSQGGIHGALAAAHFDGNAAAVMLSGAGGGTFQGALFNESSVDVSALVGLVFQFVEGEELDDFHPLASVIQHAADPADPLHTAPYWFAEGGVQTNPLSAVLVTLGTDDTFTPALTTQAMAHAGGMPVVRGSFRIPADEVFPPQVDTLPVADNVMAFDGTPVTAGVVQYPGGDHFVGLDDVERWVTFFETALVDGRARIP